MRLIDADELKKKFKDRSYWTYTHEFGDAIPVSWIMSGINDAPAVEYPQETRAPESEGTVSFKVIDKKTGKEPIFDHNHLFKQKWFKDSNLIWCDIEGWFIGEDGCLILADECGNFVYAPMDQYVPILERPQGEWVVDDWNKIIECNKCRGQAPIDITSGEQFRSNFCPICGAKMKGGAE